MHMSMLKKLHHSMIDIGIDLQQFKIQTGSVSFDCLFSVREKPFILTLTSRGLNPKFFKLNVERGYWIQPYFNDFYYELVKVLNSGVNSGNKLIPKEFLINIDFQIPGKASLKKLPNTYEIIRLRHDIVEERDKPYFDTWIHWKNKTVKPSKENMQKTLLCCGIEALEYSCNFINYSNLIIDEVVKLS